MKISRAVLVAALMGLLVLPFNAAALVQKTVTEYHPFHPSQMLACNEVDTALSKIPRGNGDGTITEDEMGPGGWRYSRTGQSFITFALTLNAGGTGYDAVAGRSNQGANVGIINDYPEEFDISLGTVPGVLTLSGHNLVITLGESDTDELRFPGPPGSGIRIVLHDRDGDGTFEGCAVSPLLANFGVTVQEGGDFIQREYFKVVATVDESGTVTYLEYTEISTFKQVKNK